jgi:BASS family bile acid:Na+ symporter
VEHIQPILIFSMLFLTFCKIDPKHLSFHRWHLWVALSQLGIFCLLGIPLLIFPHTPWRIFWESAMICLITPTATAAAVVTDKLGGNTPSLIGYVIIVNIMSALAIPIVLPLVHSNSGLEFLPAFLSILTKIFPLLIFPFLLAWMVRAWLPKFHHKVLKLKDLAFYIWAVALAIAIAVTVRSMVHSQVNHIYEIGIAIVSALCCVLQFWLGRYIGGLYHDQISAGQGFGQKNTIFTIWLGATFLTPISSVAGGFYSIWHNLYNSYQLYQRRKNE